uniref:RGS domain-containing protein n=1 Tax=Steinernema glaseri TaxID=37863 RepID=A0A1I7YPK0_9BILA
MSRFPASSIRRPRVVKHPNLLDLFKTLTDADKKVINDYMAVFSPPRMDNPAYLYYMSTAEVSPPRRETTANFGDLSPAVKNLYEDMHTYIEIPSFVDPTTERFAEQARKILAKYDALSAEEKAQFQREFPVMTGHIDDLRLYFKIDSFLDSSESHRREREEQEPLRLQMSKMFKPLC